MIQSIDIFSDSALLMYLLTSTKMVCLVIVNYATLSTDPDDKQLLMKYVSIF